MSADTLSDRVLAMTDHPSEHDCAVHGHVRRFGAGSLCVACGFPVSMTEAAWMVSHDRNDVTLLRDVTA